MSELSFGSLLNFDFLNSLRFSEQYVYFSTYLWISIDIMIELIYYQCTANVIPVETVR